MTLSINHKISKQQSLSKLNQIMQQLIETVNPLAAIDAHDGYY